ncbi:MAG: hypothetical protein OEZ47_04970 [Gammaproteobacteria bacterium]|nr:hypothetical protein [Gammaproteobacteria bacterium]
MKRMQSKQFFWGSDMKSHKRILLYFILFLFVTACGTKEEGTIEETVAKSQTGGVFARFDPTNSDLPFPTDLLFSDSLDGTINIPGLDESDLSDPQVALNAADGFSTVAPIVFNFSGEIDPATIKFTDSADDSVFVYKVTLSPQPGGAVVPSPAPTRLTTNEIAVTPVPPVFTSVAITPKVPLDSKTSYAVFVTRDVREPLAAGGNRVYSDSTYALAKRTTEVADDNGKSLVPGLTDERANKLEPLRRLVSTSEATLAGAAGINSDDIILSFSFTTQSVGEVLAKAKEAAPVTPNVSINPTADAILSAAADSGETVDVHVGTLDVPYYLKDASVSQLDPIFSNWEGLGGNHFSQFGPIRTPVAKSTQRIPLLLAVPSDGIVSRVAIFQHGITSDRTSMLAIAKTLTADDTAVVAIDLPLHGVISGEARSKTADFDVVDGLVTERHFDLDRDPTNVLLPASDGADPSGTYFINLYSLLTLRDNMRQAVADLFTLKNAISQIDYDNDTTPDFTGLPIHFVGHSLGAVVGSTFLAIDSSYASPVGDSVLGMPGGGLVKLITHSGTFGTPTNDALTAAGIGPGTPDYEPFLAVAQTMVDVADPINFGASPSTGRNLLMFEVIGDTVIPNCILSPPGATSCVDGVGPLSGTVPLAKLIGLSHVNLSQGSPGDYITKFNASGVHHRSLLDPTFHPTSTGEMQAQAALFLSSGGQLTVGDNTLLLAPTP